MVEPDVRARSRGGTTFKRVATRLGAMLGIGALSLTTFAGVGAGFSPALADDGGSAGLPGEGSGGVSGSGHEYRFWAYDLPDRSGNVINQMRTWNGWSNQALGTGEW